MESAAGFDVVEVVSRLTRLRVDSAAGEELQWADRAIDRVRPLLDAWQSAVQFRLTLPPPLPDPDPPVDPAGPRGDADWASQDVPAAEPLPSLGRPAALDSPQEALRKHRRMRLLADLPAWCEALAGGLVSTAHVDLLAAAIDKLSENLRIRVLARGDELLRSACQCTSDRFSRTLHRVIAKAFEDEGVDRRQRQREQSGLRRGVDDATGMHWLRVDLDPERGAVLFQRLDQEREAMFRSGSFTALNSDQIELQALLNLLAAGGGEQQSSAKKAHVSVIIDIATLTLGAHDRSVCETWSGASLPPDTVRELICQAEISYGLTVNGRVVHHLANARLATGDQRDQMRMMYRACAGPGCSRRFDHCQIHHIVFASRDGPTAVGLMVPLCTACHDLIHHHGWSVTIDAQRNLTWTASDGTIHAQPYVALADHDQPQLFGADGPDPPAA